MFNDLFLFFFFKGYGNTGSSNLGWNLGAAAPMPAMPMPYSPSPSNYQDDGEPGVDEVVAAKNAGAMSFAHYIVKWVSCLFLLSLLWFRESYELS